MTRLLHSQHLKAQHNQRASRVAITVFLAVLAVSLPMLPASASSSDDLVAAQAKADSLVLQLVDLETNLVVLEENIEELNSEAAETQNQIDEMSEAVRKVMVERYINGTNTPSIVASDPLETARLDTLMGAAQDKSNQLISDYQALHESLANTRQDLENQQDEEQATQADLEESIVELEAELERLSELVRLDEAKAAREAAEVAAAQAATTTTERASASRPSVPSTNRPTVPAPVTPPAPTIAAPTTTTAVAPVAPPTTAAPTTTTTPPKPPTSGNGWVCPVTPSSFVPESWGAPRSNGRSHKGVDLHAAAGTPTLAPVSGRVEHRGNDLGGLAWHLYGDDGSYYYGAHLSAYGASGQVKAGEIIGYVGATGNANGINHLHFEYHQGGKGNAVNPYSLLRAACG